MRRDLMRLPLSLNAIEVQIHPGRSYRLEIPTRVEQLRFEICSMREETDFSFRK